MSCELVFLLKCQSHLCICSLYNNGAVWLDTWFFKSTWIFKNMFVFIPFASGIFIILLKIICIRIFPDWMTAINIGICLWVSGCQYLQLLGEAREQHQILGSGLSYLGLGRKLVSFIRAVGTCICWTILQPWFLFSFKNHYLFQISHYPHSLEWIMYENYF